MIELRVLGTLDVRRRGNGAISSLLAQPKRCALLCYLLLARPSGMRRRDALLPLFWPESPEDRARNSLNQAIFTLRRSLGEAAITSTTEEVGVSPDAVWCDAVEFTGAVSAGDHERAYATYAGELLPGFHVEDCREFDEWLSGERQHLRDLAVRAAGSLADSLEAAGNPVGAVEPIRRALMWSPFDERHVVRLIGLLARLGDRPGALAEYERFRELLATEFSLEPSSALTAEAERIRLGNGRAGGAPALGPPASSASNAPGEPHTLAAPATAPPSRRWSRPPFLAAVALGLVSVVAMATTLLPSREVLRDEGPTAPVLDRQRVLVTAFENRTGDAALDPLGLMLADWIAHGVARVGAARVIPFSTIVQEASLVPPDGRATSAAPAGGLGFARRLGAGLLIEGGYYRSGDEIVLQGRVIDVATGELLRSLDEIRESPERPTEAAGELQRRSAAVLAALLDERLDSWPDAEGQPSSLDAYRLFAEGMSAFMLGMNTYRTPEGNRLFATAAGHFTAAAARDSAFTTALLWAVYAFQNSGSADSARAMMERIESRSLSPWAHAVLRHQRSSTPEEGYQAARVLAEMSPDSEWLFALGISAYRAGRVREARDAFLRLDPSRGWVRGTAGYWRLRMEVQHVTGHYRDALADAQRARAEFPQDTWLQTQELWALAALGRVDGILERLSPRIATGEGLAVWQLATAIEEMRGHGHKAASDRAVRELRRIAGDAVHARTAIRPLYAYALYAAGGDEQGLALYRDLATEHPTAGEIRVRHAVLEMRQGRREPAEAVLAWLRLLEGPSLRAAAPVEQERYWGSAAGWRLLSEARLLAVLGEPELAIDRIEAALRSGLEHGYLHLHDDPDFDALRSRPRFQALLRSRD